MRFDVYGQEAGKLRKLAALALHQSRATTDPMTHEVLRGIARQYEAEAQALER